MKRYLVFMFDDYDAAGGMNDFKEDFDCFESACEELKKQVSDGYSGHVWDSVERKICVELSAPVSDLSFASMLPNKDGVSLGAGLYAEIVLNGVLGYSGAIVTAYDRPYPAAYDLLGNIVPQPINPEDDCC